VPRASGSKQTKAARRRAEPLKTKYLIVGNSVGAVGAVEAIRRIDASGSLTILSDEPHFAYSRPMIAEYLAGECSLDHMRYRLPDFYETNCVQALLGHKAVRVDFQAKLVELDDGRKIAWRKLLLATGGTPIVPKMDGVDRKNVFTFTTVADAEEMKRALPAGATVVVIGGGLIGISASQALSRRGNSVVMVELMDRVLSAALDKRASRLVEKTLQATGIDIVTGHTVEEITGTPEEEGRVAAVVLNDGRRINCQAIIVAIGVLPRTNLIAGTAVRTNRGIVVDRHMATSCSDIYACGDAAEAYDFLRSEEKLTPIWPNAFAGGRIAGFNMAGRSVVYEGTTNMNSFNYFGLPIISAGIVEPPSTSSYKVLQSPVTNGGTYQRIVLQDNRVVGMVFVGDIQSAGIVIGLMRNRVDVRRFQRSLVSSGLSLASLPGELRQAMLAQATPTAV